MLRPRRNDITAPLSPRLQTATVWINAGVRHLSCRSKTLTEAGSDARTPPIPVTTLPSQKVASSTLNRSVLPQALVSVGWCFYMRCSRCLPLPNPLLLSLDQLPTSFSPPPTESRSYQGYQRDGISSVTTILFLRLHYNGLPRFDESQIQISSFCVSCDNIFEFQSPCKMLVSFRLVTLWPCLPLDAASCSVATWIACLPRTLECSHIETRPRVVGTVPHAVTPM